MRFGMMVLVMMLCLGRPAVASAETLMLKSGKAVEGDVVEKTEDHVTVDTGEKLVEIPFDMMHAETVEAFQDFPETLLPVEAMTEEAAAEDMIEAPADGEAPVPMEEPMEAAVPSDNDEASEHLIENEAPASDPVQP